MTQMIHLKRQVVLGVMRRMAARVATAMKGRRKNPMRKNMRRRNLRRRNIRKTKNNQMIEGSAAENLTICCQKCKVQRGVSSSPILCWIRIFSEEPIQGDHSRRTPSFLMGLILGSPGRRMYLGSLNHVFT
jgi:hypothetical protein